MADLPPDSCLVVTNRDGRILELDDPAAKLLNMTVRGLERNPRTLAMFFDGERDMILRAQRDAGPDASAPLQIALRPRERAARRVTVTVCEAADGFLEWTIQPVASS